MDRWAHRYVDTWTHGHPIGSSSFIFPFPLSPFPFHLSLFIILHSLYTVIHLSPAIIHHQSFLIHHSSFIVHHSTHFSTCIFFIIFHLSSSIMYHLSSIMIIIKAWPFPAPQSLCVSPGPQYSTLSLRSAAHFQVIGGLACHHFSGPAMWCRWKMRCICSSLVVGHADIIPLR